MKLLLTSAGISTQAISDELLKMAGKTFTELKVAFIPTAADTYEDKWFVIKDRKQLTDLGMSVMDVNINGKTPQEVSTALGGCDIIFVAGGNTFYLLQKIRESGADQVIKDLVERGVIYIGSSAGSVVVGPSLKPIKTSDDPSQAPQLKSFEGLGFVDFVILPHSGKEKYLSKHNALVEEYKDRYKLILITDEQAIAVEDGEYKII